MTRSLITYRHGMRATTGISPGKKMRLGFFLPTMSLNLVDPIDKSTLLLIMRTKKTLAIA